MGKSWEEVDGDEKSLAVLRSSKSQVVCPCPSVRLLVIKLFENCNKTEIVREKYI